MQRKTYPPRAPLVLSVCFVDRCFVLFLLAIVLSVLLRYTDSDYPFGIFRLFLNVSLRIFEDTKGVIRSRKSKKDRQHNGQTKKRTNNDLQNIIQKTKDQAIRTPLTTGRELRSSRRLSSSYSTSVTRLRMFLEI